MNNQEKSYTHSTLEEKKRLLLFLTIIGSIGVLSLLLFKGAILSEVSEYFDEKYPFMPPDVLIFIVPSTLLAIGLITGTVFYDIAGFKLPIFEALIRGKMIYKEPGFLGKISFVAGLLVAMIVYLLSRIFLYSNPESSILMEVWGHFFANRTLLSAFSESILVQFGLFSFFTWMLQLAFKTDADWVKWLAMLIVCAFTAKEIADLIIDKLFMIDMSLNWWFYFWCKFSADMIFCWVYWKHGLGVTMIGQLISGFILSFLL